MLKKQVIGYGVLVSRSNSKPQIVILIPQVHPYRCFLSGDFAVETLTRSAFSAEQEEELIDGVRVSSAGIHLCQLPYADDIREHGLTSTLSIIEPPSE